MPKIKAAVLALLTLALSAPLLAQEDQEGADPQDYQKMMQQMMKSANYSQNQAESWDARLKVVSGEVMVKPSDSEEWSKITGEIPLNPDDSIKTASDGVAELYLDDKGAVSLGRNTQLDVATLDQGDTVFNLNYGSITAKIKHFLNDKFKMQVRTPAAVCAVRGTEFAVEHSQLGKDTAVAVFDEGRLAVTPQTADGGESQEYVLEKNTELSIGPSQKRFRPGPVARMSRYRSAVAQMRSRVSALKNWKPRSAARRAALRDQALKRKVIRRQLKDRKTKARTRRPVRAKTRRARPAPAEAAPEDEIQEPSAE